MPAYRFFILDLAGHFEGAQVIEAESDILAVEKADQLWAGLGVPGYELWRRSTFIARRLEAGSSGLRLD